MSLSDFDGAQFWPGIKQFVANAGVEPISVGEPEDEIWRKIFEAAAAVGSPLSLGMTPGELMRAAYAMSQGGGWSYLDLGGSLFDALDAERADTLTLSGSVVNSWATVKNGYAFSQSISAAKPVFSATGLAGRPAVALDGQDDELTFEGVGNLPVDAAAVEIWALADQLTPASSSAARLMLAYGGNSGNTRRGLIRAVVGGVNRAQATAGSGASSVAPSNTEVDFTGRHVVRGVIDGSNVRADVDGAAGNTSSLMPATGSTRIRIGANTGDTAAGFWQGAFNLIAFTKPLTNEQAAQMLAYLKSRGGIA